MALYTKRQCFEPLQQDKGVERADGRPGIAQQYRPDANGVGSRTGSIYEAYPVITRIGFRQLREFTGSNPVKPSAVYDDTPKEVPCPPINLVAE